MAQKDKSEIKQDGGDGRPTPANKPPAGVEMGEGFMMILASPGMRAVLPIFVRDIATGRLMGFAVVSHPGAIVPGGFLDQELRKIGVSGAKFELASTGQPMHELHSLTTALDDYRKDPTVDLLACRRAYGLSPPAI